MPPAKNECRHKVLQLNPSPFAPLAGYTQPTPQKRAAAVPTSDKSVKNAVLELAQSFPAPLVLPHDELNYDPDDPPQSVKEWLHMDSRNDMSPKYGRDTIYIGRVPTFQKKVEFMRDWTTPIIDSPLQLQDVSSPDADLFVDYLKTFYHGMKVKILPTSLSWTTWGAKSSQPRRKANLPKYIGLAHGTQCTRIRVRNAPDGAFTAQLNLDDIIDAAIAMLPADAYAICLLVDHDIHESDEDDFCCGRAYGGSRVSVVQTARYNPLLDLREGIDRAHMWPLSHCKDFVDELCAVEDVLPKPATKQQVAMSKSGAMRAAVDAAVVNTDSLDSAQALWFSRLARTVSHELGHCFGIAHCVYFACNMQGTAGMKEDVRQPPYLCPMCEAKVCHAIVRELQNGGEQEKRTWTKERCVSTRDFCARLQDVDMQIAMWRGLGAWSTARLETLP